MDPNMPVGPKLTREQILYEQECCLKISDLYALGYTGMLGTFLGVGGATLLALKGRGLVAKVLVPTLTGGVATIAVSAAVFQKNVGEAVQNGTFERDIPLCLARESMIIMVDPNLSENEKKVQAEKFSQEYYAKLENDGKPISRAVADLFQSQAPITPTDTPPVNSEKPKRYNKYGDEIQDDS